MLAFAQQPGRPSLRLLVLHDDPEREFAYTAGAEQALEQAKARGGRWSASATTGPRSSRPPADAEPAVSQPLTVTRRAAILPLG
jgi:hypothetical protein